MGVFELTSRYLPGYEDLFKYLFSLHQHIDIPRVVIVESLDHYCNLAYKSVHNKDHEQEMHAAFVCASLIDATSLCAIHGENPAVLIASFHCNDKEIKPLINLFFSDIVWSVQSDTGNGIALTNAIILPEQSSQKQIVFKAKNWDGKLILHKILQLINIKEMPADTKNKVQIQA